MKGCPITVKGHRQTDRTTPRDLHALHKASAVPQSIRLSEQSAVSHCAHGVAGQGIALRIGGTRRGHRSDGVVGDEWGRDTAAQRRARGVRGLIGMEHNGGRRAGKR